jgi:NIMA (never in mitosis gene a)-related kinase
LHYLHGKKVLHRDLKAANVFLMKDTEQSNPFFLVKIGDLGVAKLLDTSTAFAQTIVGTPYYLSPELCTDQPYRDKSDCWALGVLLYEVRQLPLLLTNSRSPHSLGYFCVLVVFIAVLDLFI